MTDLKNFLYFFVIIGVVGYSTFKFRQISRSNKTKTPLAANKPLVLPQTLKMKKNPMDNLQIDKGKPSLINKMREIQNKIVSEFNDKNYQNALDITKKHLANKEYKLIHPWLNEQLPVIYSALGSVAFRKKDCDTAIIYFENSLAISENLNAMRGLLSCSNLSGNYEKTLKYCRTVLAEKFDSQAVKVCLRGFEKNNQNRQAKNFLELLESKYPNRKVELKQLSKQLAGQKKRLEKAKQQKSLHFESEVPYSFYNFENTLHTHLEETLYWLVNEYGFSYPRSHIRVVIYESKNNLGAATHSPTWAAGLYDGSIRAPYNEKNEKESLRTLTHELVHALVAERTKGFNLAIWINEGIAQYLECLRHDCKPYYFVSQPKKFIGKKIFNMKVINLPASSARDFYSQSLYIIHFLADKYGDVFIQRLVLAISQRNLDSIILFHKMGLNLNEVMEEVESAWNSKQKL